MTKQQEELLNAMQLAMFQVLGEFYGTSATPTTVINRLFEVMRENLNG